MAPARAPGIPGPPSRGHDAGVSLRPARISKARRQTPAVWSWFRSRVQVRSPGSARTYGPPRAVGIPPGPWNLAGIPYRVALAGRSDSDARCGRCCSAAAGANWAPVEPRVLTHACTRPPRPPSLLGVRRVVPGCASPLLVLACPRGWPFRLKRRRFVHAAARHLFAEKRPGKARADNGPQRRPWRPLGIYAVSGE